MKKIVRFSKAKKGAELVEIILGVAIAVVLVVIAGKFIADTIKGNTELTDTDIDDLPSKKSSYVVEDTSATTASSTFSVGDYVIEME